MHSAAYQYRRPKKTAINPAQKSLRNLINARNKVNNAVKRMNIRTATENDRNDVKRVHLCAFPEAERELVSKLAIDLLSEKTIPETISLVAVIEETIVGHIAFSALSIDNDENFRGYILAPLAVSPEHQKRRIGSTLIEYGLQQLSVAGVKVVFVYGDPKYYGRFGFRADVAEPFAPPYRLKYPYGWQAIALNEAAIGKTPGKLTVVASLRNPHLW